MPIDPSRLRIATTTQKPFSAEELDGMDLQSLIMMLSLDLKFTLALLTEHPALLNQCIHSKKDLDELSDVTDLIASRFRKDCRGMVDPVMAVIEAIDNQNETAHGPHYVGTLVESRDVVAAACEHADAYQAQLMELFRLIPRIVQYFSSVKEFMEFAKYNGGSEVSYSTEGMVDFVVADETFDAHQLMQWAEDRLFPVPILIDMASEVLVERLEAAEPSVFQAMTYCQERLMEQLARHQPERVAALLEEPAATKASAPPCGSRDPGLF